VKEKILWLNQVPKKEKEEREGGGDNGFTASARKKSRGKGRISKPLIRKRRGGKKNRNRCSV